MGPCLTREDKIEESSWLDIAMRDKKDRESDKQMGKQQTERQTACCYRLAAIGMLRSMQPLQHLPTIKFEVRDLIGNLILTVIL